MWRNFNELVGPFNAPNEAIQLLKGIAVSFGASAVNYFDS